MNASLWPLKSDVTCDQSRHGCTGLAPLSWQQGEQGANGTRPTGCFSALPPDFAARPSRGLTLCPPLPRRVEYGALKVHLRNAASGVEIYLVTGGWEPMPCGKRYKGVFDTIQESTLRSLRLHGRAASNCCNASGRTRRRWGPAILFGNRDVRLPLRAGRPAPSSGPGVHEGAGSRRLVTRADDAALVTLTTDNAAGAEP